MCLVYMWRISNNRSFICIDLIANVFRWRYKTQYYFRICLHLFSVPSFNFSWKKKKKLKGAYSWSPWKESVNYSSSLPRAGGSVLSVSDSWPGGCEFDPQLNRLLFPAYFYLSPLQKHVRKVVSGFGKKICVSTGLRKPGNTYASPTAMINLLKQSCRSLPSPYTSAMG